MNAWLEQQADALAAAAGLDRETLQLDAEASRTLLDLARIAAHEGGDRTNAPLLCYLVGLARVGGKSLDELAEAVRGSTS
jgi:Domain of unknown function (DUF6457)